jgi:asparagine synthase (glutamine-hydrolysing)
LQLYPEVIWHTEEPKENVIQGFLLARHARKHVTVALSGLGGDELFAGYEIYKYLALGQQIGSWIPKSLQKMLLNPLSYMAFEMQTATKTLSFDLYRRALQLLLASGDSARFYLILRNVWDKDSRQWQNLYGPRLLEERLSPTGDYFQPYFSEKAKNLIGDGLRAEFHTKMVEDFLNNEDRVSMANGVEVRVPFLDRDLVELAFSIPPELKYRNGAGKYIFRKAMEGILPKETLQKPKWGFSFSSYHQFNKDLKSTAERILTKERVMSQGLFNYEYLRRIIEHKPTPRMFWHYFFLWNAIGITIWEDIFIHNDFRQPSFSLTDYMV